MANPLHVVVVAGTRPEVIKQAPVIMALRADPERFRTTFLVTGQHREMLDQALQSFNLIPDVNLDLMTENQTLAKLTGMVVTHVQEVLSSLKPDCVLVQGDTTTAFGTALASFYQGIKVGHVEAGLRTYDRANPFPEEMNRCLIASLADLHFVPTQRAEEALKKEGINTNRIVITGNTVVDALEYLQKAGPNPSFQVREIVRNANDRIILVTCHRRESFGSDLSEIINGLAQLARNYPDYRIVFPMHLNPNLRKQVKPRLEGIDNIILCEPMPHPDLLYILKHAQLVITDSGGIQEEAPSFGVPVIVIRNATERSEGIEAGFSKLVAPNATAIATQAREWLDTNHRTTLLQKVNPYGDGNAAQRILASLVKDIP